jgi:L-cysteine:1D-myo-inositol 2-amino-2-deoxy-alpha-D-glucopyranoside ligase
MSLQIYDTAQRSVVDFSPDPLVKMYVCGITPYDSTHLGHAATYLAYDVLIRRLEELGHEVQLVRNFTDIDDPLYERALKNKVDPVELAQAEIERFQADALALNLRPACAEPRVSDSIPNIIEFISDLIDSGHAYSRSGTVYFDVTKFDGFGKLSGLDEAEMVALSAERGGSPDDPNQRNPLDFVLWKPSHEGEASWPTPWGAGRPGWHIECSSMAHDHFGDTLDLHGGGTDLIFPHHEGEIAQSEAQSGKTFSRHWMHVGMVAYHGEKMSKSLGNLVFVQDLREQYDPRAIRLAVHARHYRHGFEWFDDDMNAGIDLLELLELAAKRETGPDPEHFEAEFRSCIDNDLDTPSALDVLAGYAQSSIDGGTSTDAPAALRSAAQLLGVQLQD